jgi:hypothetical protein
MPHILLGILVMGNVNRPVVQLSWFVDLGLALDMICWDATAEIAS